MSKLDTLFDNELIKIVGEKPSPSRFSHRSDLQKEPIGENTKFLYSSIKTKPAITATGLGARTRMTSSNFFSITLLPAPWSKRPEPMTREAMA